MTCHEMTLFVCDLCRSGLTTDSVSICSRIVFQNVFADIDANNIIALCSCLVFDEKSEDPITNNLDLMKAFETCKGIAKKCGGDNGQGLSRSNISIIFHTFRTIPS